MQQDPRNEADLFDWMEWGDVPMEAAIPFTIVATANVLQRVIGRILSRHAVTLPQWMALRVLLRVGEEGVSFTTLSRCLMLSKAPLTGIMDRLEREGLARRVPSKTDRRVIRAVITEAGLQRIEAVKPDLIEWKDRGFAGLSREDRVVLRDLLRRLLADILAQPEAAPERESRHDSDVDESTPDPKPDRQRVPAASTGPTELTAVRLRAGDAASPVRVRGVDRSQEREAGGGAARPIGGGTGGSGAGGWL